MLRGINGEGFGHHAIGRELRSCECLGGCTHGAFAAGTLVLGATCFFLDINGAFKESSVFNHDPLGRNVARSGCLRLSVRRYVAASLLFGPLTGLAPVTAMLS